MFDLINMASLKHIIVHYGFFCKQHRFHDENHPSGDLSYTNTTSQTCLILQQEFWKTITEKRNLVWSWFWLDINILYFLPKNQVPYNQPSWLCISILNYKVFISKIKIVQIFLMQKRRVVMANLRISSKQFVEHKSNANYT